MMGATEHLGKVRRRDSRPMKKTLLPLTGDGLGALVPPFIKGGVGGAETAAQANVAKSPLVPL
jgi:hypothetical protein